MKCFHGKDETFSGTSIHFLDSLDCDCARVSRKAVFPEVLQVCYKKVSLPHASRCDVPTEEQARFAFRLELCSWFDLNRLWLEVNKTSEWDDLECLGQFLAESQLPRRAVIELVGCYVC